MDGPAAGCAGRFHVYVLSDTSLPDILSVEAEAFGELARHWAGRLALTYRRRTTNTGYKAGNIRDFLERWGDAHELMVTLDADSYMTASAILSGPDGACVDADGFLWNAHFEGRCLVRYAPSGAVDRVVALPVANPTSCCFGGANLDVLFVTSASDPALTGQAPSEVCGKLIALDVGCRGLPEPEFGG